MFFSTSRSGRAGCCRLERGSASRQMIKRTEYCAIYYMCEKCDDWCASSVIKRHKSGRFKLARRFRSVVYARHTRMQARKEGQHHDQDKHTVPQSAYGSKPP